MSSKYSSRPKYWECILPRRGDDRHACDDRRLRGTAIFTARRNSHSLLTFTSGDRRLFMKKWWCIMEILLWNRRKRSAWVTEKWLLLHFDRSRRIMRSAERWYSSHRARPAKYERYVKALIAIWWILQRMLAIALVAYIDNTKRAKFRCIFTCLFINVGRCRIVNNGK